mmetsp:Transcript_36309/g.66517  ORF Transcript_36309/g.66517 Transcript_36309/m.66517 type:complete len:149 (+) Transcript_36309:97-543(+)
MAVRLLVALLAASSLAKVYGLTCFSGQTETYTNTGGCTTFTDINAWTTQSCGSGSTYCYTQSYAMTIGNDCRYEGTYGGCGTGTDYCTTLETAYGSMYGTTGSGYACETCNTDDCNPTTAVGRTSGSTRVTVTVAALLGAVAAALARL